MVASSKPSEISRPTKKILVGLRGLGGSLLVKKPSSFTVFGAGQHDGMVAQGTLLNAFESDFAVLDFGELAKHLTPSSRAVLSQSQITISGTNGQHRFNLAEPHALKFLQEQVQRLSEILDCKQIASFFLSSDHLARYTKAIRVCPATHVRFVKTGAGDAHFQVMDLRVHFDQVYDLLNKFRHTFQSKIEGAVADAFEVSFKAATCHQTTMSRSTNVGWRSSLRWTDVSHICCGTNGWALSSIGPLTTYLTEVLGPCFFPTRTDQASVGRRSRQIGAEWGFTLECPNQSGRISLVDRDNLTTEDGLGDKLVPREPSPKCSMGPDVLVGTTDRMVKNLNDALKTIHNRPPVATASSSWRSGFSDTCGR